MAAEEVAGPSIETEPGTPGRLSHSLYRVARLHRALAGQLLREIGLYPPQELVMMRLWRDGPQRQADLVRALDSDAATMTRMIRRLERAGFVRRTPDPLDRRAGIVEATPASTAILGDVDRVWGALDDALINEMTAGEQQALAEALSRMEENLRIAENELGAEASEG